MIEILDFKGEEFKVVEVKINDDENWEPDEDFYVQLYQTETEKELRGQDTKTRVTIIDDDKPGQIAYDESKNIKAIASEGKADIIITRKNGSDGEVTVDYKTYSLSAEDHNA